MTPSRARMLGAMRPSWCQACHAPPGPDCADMSRTKKAVRGAERRETRREYHGLIRNGRWGSC